VKTKIALISFVASLVLAASTTQAADWSDTSLHYWVSTNFAEPGVSPHITKNIFSVEHVDGYKYGTNFFNIDFLYSQAHSAPFQDTVQGLKNVPSTGALEVYAVYRHTLSFSKISGTKVAFGPIRDVGLELGVDANTKNDAFASKKIMPIGGLKFSFDVPGFLDVSIDCDKEWNDNAILGKSVVFNPTLNIGAAWGIPVAGPVSFEGFADVNFPKGKDGFDSKTVTEILLHPKLMADLATLWGSKGIQAGVGYQFWMNKFGGDHNAAGAVGEFEKAFFGEIAAHF
jgi:nucleoside-specific outer membrane channel protein Tsx